MNKIERLRSQESRPHFIRFMLLHLGAARSHMDAGVVYEGLYQMVAAELKVAKYCWDEVFGGGNEGGARIVANSAEKELRKIIGSMMHAANILVEAEHMIEQEYPMSSTETTFNQTLNDLHDSFNQLNETLKNLVSSRSLYREDQPLNNLIQALLEGHYGYPFITE